MNQNISEKLAKNVVLYINNVPKCDGENGDCSICILGGIIETDAGSRFTTHKSLCFIFFHDTKDDEATIEELQKYTISASDTEKIYLEIIKLKEEIYKKSLEIKIDGKEIECEYIGSEDCNINCVYYYKHCGPIKKKVGTDGHFEVCKHFKLMEVRP